MTWMMLKPRWRSENNGLPSLIISGWTETEPYQYHYCMYIKYQRKDKENDGLIAAQLDSQHFVISPPWTERDYYLKLHNDLQYCPKLVSFWNYEVTMPSILSVHLCCCVLLLKWKWHSPGFCSNEEYILTGNIPITICVSIVAENWIDVFAIYASAHTQPHNR